MSLTTRPHSRLIKSQQAGLATWVPNLPCDESTGEKGHKSPNLTHTSSRVNMRVQPLNYSTFLVKSQQTGKVMDHLTSQVPNMRASLSITQPHLLCHIGGKDQGLLDLPGTQ